MVLSMPITHVGEHIDQPPGDEEIDLLRYILQNIEYNVPYLLNLNNPQQIQFALRTLELGGETQDVSPFAHALIQAMPQRMAEMNGRNRGDRQPFGGPRHPDRRPNDRMSKGRWGNDSLGNVVEARPEILNDDTPPLAMAAFETGQETSQLQAWNTVDSFFVDDALNYHATVFSTVPKGTQKTSIVLNVIALDNDNNVVETTYRSATEFLQGEKFGITSTGQLNPNYKDKRAVLAATFYTFDQDNHAHIYIMATPHAAVANFGCLIAPTYKGYQGTNTCISELMPQRPLEIRDIVSCWWRDGGDCDYKYEDGNPTTFIFPLMGSVRFDEPVFVNEKGFPVGTFTFTLTPNAGGAVMLATGNNDQTTVISTDAALESQENTINAPLQGFQVAGNIVQFNFPETHFANNGALQKGGVVTAFDIYLSVRLQTPNKYATARFTSNAQNGIVPGVFIVPGMKIAYGCLAAGSIIRMADGSEKSIETFVGDGTETVKSAQDGTTRTVIGVTPGTEPDPCVFVVAANSHTLLMTEGHPIVTVNRGIQLAKNLALGDILITEDGESPVIELARKQYEGEVWNLDVGTAAQAAQELTTFFANGILVGDSAMQEYYGELDWKARQTNPFAELPQAWHADYLNFMTKVKK
jgi:hypothetical protein